MKTTDFDDAAFENVLAEKPTIDDKYITLTAITLISDAKVIFAVQMPKSRQQYTRLPDAIDAYNQV